MSSVVRLTLTLFTFILFMTTCCSMTFEQLENEMQPYILTDQDSSDNETDSASSTKTKRGYGGFPDEFYAEVQDVSRSPYAPSNWEGCGYKDAIKTAQTGRVSSPNHPKIYPNMALCGWRLEAPSGMRIRLTFSIFDLEIEKNCLYDSLEIYDGSSVRSPYLGSFCGSDIPRQVVSNGSALYLVFYSDRNFGKTGFNANYRTEKNPDISEPGIPVEPPTEGPPVPDEGCGLTPITPKFDRIVGGEAARPHSWPWMVRFGRPGGSHFCGGTLISETWVLSAAHCFYRNSQPISVDGLVAVVGEHDRRSNQADLYEEVRSISRVLTPRYPSGSRQYGNDIALVRLSSPVMYNDGVQPACLPVKDVAARTICVGTGWGTTQSTGSNLVLRQVALPVIGQSTCRRSDYYGNLIKDDMMCAGFEQGGKDTCSGDSGGPLACKDPSSGRWYLHGITSWGSGCAQRKKPGVYTRVIYHDSWLFSEAKADEEAEEEEFQEEEEGQSQGVRYKKSKGDKSTIPEEEISHRIARALDAIKYGDEEVLRKFLKMFDDEDS